MKKTYKLIIAALFFAITFPTFASSEISIAASLNSNTLGTSIDYYDERSTSNVMGYSLSIPYQYNFNDRISLRSEFKYISKNYTEDTYQSIDKSITSEYHYNSYFELPFMGRIYFFPTNNYFKPFINLGGFYSYWLTASTIGMYLNISSASGVETLEDSNYTTIKTKGFDDNDNRHNFGLLGGIGFEIQIQQHLKVSFETRITTDITSIYSINQINTVNEYNENIEGNFSFVYSF